MPRTLSSSRPRRPALGRLLALFGVLVTGAAQTSYALNVTLVEWNVGSLTTRLESTASNDLCCGGSTVGFDPVSVPFSDTHRAESGGVFAEATYSLTSTGFSIVLTHYRHPRSASIGNGAIYFSLDADSPYELTGSYSMTGYNEIRLEAALADSVEGYLFDSMQESFHTYDESFQLGVEEGDNRNRFSGSPSGMLQGGQVYRLSYRAAIGSSSSADDVASASGSIQLTFIPEPSTAALLAFGLLGLAARRRLTA
jgi:hypothetical protein